MPWFYYVARAMVRMCLRLTRRRVVGKENVPQQGPLLVVANHLSLVDPPLLGITLEREVTFMAKKELFRFPPLGYLMRGFGAFPVHRGQLDIAALRQAQQALTEGRVLVMFPEGMRSRSGHLRPAFSGAALIALRSGAPILPVGIAGTEKMKWPVWVFRRPRITVNIGVPFHLPPGTDKPTRAELADQTDYIMRHIARLLPEQYRGDYAD